MGSTSGSEPQRKGNLVQKDIIEGNPGCSKTSFPGKPAPSITSVDDRQQQSGRKGKADRSQRQRRKKVGKIFNHHGIDAPKNAYHSQ